MPTWFEALARQTPNAGAGLLVTAVVALAVARPLGRRLALPAVGVAAWVAALGLVASLTLTPRSTWAAVTERVCTLDTWTPLGLDSVLALDQRAANAVMLVPLAVLSALPRERRRLVGALTVAAVLPLVVEAVQYALPGLGRICHSEDLVDNLAGVAVGAVVGLAARWALSRRARGHERDAAATSVAAPRPAGPAPRPNR
ncbi:hypothetical protein Cfla_3523 [Cellulomonas flavigena DSM 20109]|uniref:VanZ-like domain-containing protein n=1 Tax=Cellulomonas flavigena (strain ATCC 482 / DSM 20109 / BCRC 11376 / JCM 18109 / NBRC 3775 / NCIMB 8073 / NRS 134) TaxID=446466 RepID=D5UDD9_CELFN|nr:VanZ family protein [Cellulomonas flavigena]ADG76395.1 hypothetical protein Cfla_3523 [Cellulomonas flavigena DSM 20109]